MSYGYVGDTSTSIKQQVKNAGVLSVSDVLDLEGKGQLGGSLELIEEVTASGSTTVDFTSIQENKYDVHLFTFDDINVTVDGDRLKLRFFESGVVESGSVYQYATQQCDTAGFSESKSTSNTDLPTIKNTGTAGNEQSNGYTYIYNAGNSSKYTFTTYHSTAISNSGSYNSWFGGGVLPQASTVDGFRLFSSGNITGTIKLYGVKQI